MYLYREMSKNSTLAQLQSMKYTWLPSQEAKPWLVQEVCDPVDVGIDSSFFHPLFDWGHNCFRNATSAY